MGPLLPSNSLKTGLGSAAAAVSSPADSSVLCHWCCTGGTGGWRGERSKYHHKSMPNRAMKATQPITVPTIAPVEKQGPLLESVLAVAVLSALLVVFGDNAPPRAEAMELGLAVMTIVETMGCVSVTGKEASSAESVSVSVVLAAPGCVGSVLAAAASDEDEDAASADESWTNIVLMPVLKIGATEVCVMVTVTRGCVLAAGAVPTSAVAVAIAVEPPWNCSFHASTSPSWA